MRGSISDLKAARFWDWSNSARSADKLYFALEFYSRGTNIIFKFLLQTIYRGVPGETERKKFTPLNFEIYRRDFAKRHSVKF